MLFKYFIQIQPIRFTHRLCFVIFIQRSLIHTREKAVKNLHRLSEPQNHRCCYCGNKIFRWSHEIGKSTPPNAITRDHVEAKTHGGKQDGNLVASCFTCNNLRGDMDAIAFYNILQKWFQRDITLRTRWHSLSKTEFQSFHHQCLLIENRLLHGRGIRDIEYAFRHMRYIRLHGHRIGAY